MTLRSEIAKFTADVPKDWRPAFDNRGGSYNFSDWPVRGLPAANVGKGHTGQWMLMDPWGTVWSFGFDSRLEAARFAYALVLKNGNVPLDWLTATA